MKGDRMPTAHDQETAGACHEHQMLQNSDTPLYHRRELPVRTRPFVVCERTTPSVTTSVCCTTQILQHNTPPPPCVRNAHMHSRKPTRTRRLHATAAHEHPDT
jgi:hypothetical protein